MASYKAEALHARHRGRLRPRSHYALGWLPRWTRLVGRSRALTRLANASLRLRALHPVVTWSAGVDRRRGLPQFAEQTFRSWFAGRPTGAAPAPRGDVVLFVDTFTDGFSPEVGRAAVAVLEDAGYRVRVTERAVCCGLTWISTGQARRRPPAPAGHRARAAAVRAGRCAGRRPRAVVHRRAALGRARACCPTPSLPDAQAVVAATRTLAEPAGRDRRLDGARPVRRPGRRAAALPPPRRHGLVAGRRACWPARARRSSGSAAAAAWPATGASSAATTTCRSRSPSSSLLPAVRAADDGTTVLADGFACRTRLADLTDRQGEHLAQAPGPASASLTAAEPAYARRRPSPKRSRNAVTAAGGVRRPVTCGQAPRTPASVRARW
nr:hypothetical protein [Angustibacter aerolatus]